MKVISVGKEKELQAYIEDELDGADYGYGTLEALETTARKLREAVAGLAVIMIEKELKETSKCFYGITTNQVLRSIGVSSVEEVHSE